jgi:hypothetical protein
MGFATEKPALADVACQCHPFSFLPSSSDAVRCGKQRLHASDGFYGLRTVYSPFSDRFHPFFTVFLV